MALRFYNTLSHKLEDFKPITPNKVNFFVCGPTVYNHPHLGNAKTYTQFDVIARYLRYKGYEVFYLQNITDIDDKIIREANMLNISWKELTIKFENIYKEDMESFGNTSVNEYARASDYIPKIITQIKTLQDKGYAYKIDDGIYFEVSKFKEYGKLSGRTKLKEEDSVSRIDESNLKKGWNDFCLWKSQKPNEPYWESEIGKGRPGWHIEDTAITESYFGPQYDIHGGASDLIFPHHECEIAQMETASGKKPFVKYWLHAGFLNIEAKKMAKSANNFYTLADIKEKGLSPLAFRYLILGSHYRKPLNFTWQSIESAQSGLDNLYGRYLELGEKIGKISKEYKDKFIEVMDDDIETPKALALVWEILKDGSVSDADKKTTLIDFDKVLGLGLDKLEPLTLPNNVKILLGERELARGSKNWQLADEIRQKIEGLGYIIKDTEQGPKIVKKDSVSTFLT